MEFIPFKPDMEFTDIGHPVFDCDFHFYETAEAFTRYLPEAVHGAGAPGEHRRAHEDDHSGPGLGLHPQPHLRGRGRARLRAASTSPARNTEGKYFREIVTPDAVHPRVHRPRCPPGPHGPHAHPGDRELPDPGFARSRSTSWTTPSATQVADPRLQPVDVRRVGLRLRRPDLHHPGDEPGDGRGGGRRSSSGRSSVARRPCSCGPRPVAGFRGSKSPFLPELDPFWARIQEAGIPVMLHASDSGYTRYANDWNGLRTSEMRPFEQDAFASMLRSRTGRSWTPSSRRSCHGMLSRFPDVQDRGRSSAAASWITRVVEDAARPVRQDCRSCSPSTRSRRSSAALYVAPFWEDPLEPLIDAIGLDHVLFNSDWPHPEGLADPVEYAVLRRDEVGLLRRRRRQGDGRRTCST